MNPIDYNNPNENWMQTGYDPYKELNDTERMGIGCVSELSVIAGIILGLLLCALLSGCTTTKYVPVIEHRTDTVRITQHQRDSLYFCDSIYTIVRTEGDTVYQQTDRWRIRYVERTQTDTLYQSKIDSIPYPVEVTKEVPAPLTWWQQTRMHVGGIVIFLLIIFAVWKIYVALHPRL